MDPLFLTFRNDALERGYRNQLLHGVSKYKCSAVGMLLALRSIVLVVSQPGDVRAALSSVAPLADMVVRKSISKQLLEQYGALLQLVFGFAYSFLALGGGVKAVLMSPSSTKTALVFGFTTTQLFTMFWYRLRLPHQIVLNAATVVFGLGIYLDPICSSVDTMGWSSFMENCVCRMDHFFGGVFLGSGGIDSEHCQSLGILACRQVYMFVHIFFGVLVFSCWLWYAEKRDRIQYVMHRRHQGHHQELATEIINNTGSCGISFLEWVYVLFLLWQTLMVFTLMGIRHSRSAQVGNTPSPL